MIAHHDLLILQAKLIKRKLITMIIIVNNQMQDAKTIIYKSKIILKQLLLILKSENCHLIKMKKKTIKITIDDFTKNSSKISNIIADIFLSNIFLLNISLLDISLLNISLSNIFLSNIFLLNIFLSNIFQIDIIQLKATHFSIDDKQLHKQKLKQVWLQMIKKHSCKCQKCESKIMKKFKKQIRQTINNNRIKMMNNHELIKKIKRYKKKVNSKIMKQVRKKMKTNARTKIEQKKLIAKLKKRKNQLKKKLTVKFNDDMFQRAKTKTKKELLADFSKLNDLDEKTWVNLRKRKSIKTEMIVEKFDCIFRF